MTIEEAKSVTPGQVLYLKNEKNRDGTPQRWRVNGQVKTWKRDASRVKVPLKHGMYAFGYMDEGNIHLLCLTEEEAMA